MSIWSSMTPEQKKDPKLFWVNFLNPERGVKVLQNLAKAIEELNKRTSNAKRK